MTYMARCAFITRNIIGTGKLGQDLVTGMTETTVPKSGGGQYGGEGGSAGYWWKEQVEVARNIAPGDYAPSLKVLHREAKWVKLNRTVVISGKVTNGN